MKRKFILLVTILCIVLSAFALVACAGKEGGGSGSSSANGTYYRYKNDKLDKTDYIKIDGGKWTGDTGDSGEFAVSGTEFIMYAEMYGEKMIVAKGTVSDGVITVIERTSAGTRKMYYCKEGKTPPKDDGTGTGSGGSSGIGGDSGNSGSASNVQKVTVTYNSNGGEFSDGKTTFTQNVELNSKLTAPTAPTRVNYAFAGWAKNKNGSDMWAFATDEVSEATTLYAIWAEESAKIFSVDGASLTDDSIFMLVSSSTDSVSLANKIVCSSDSTWRLYYDKLGQTEIPTKIAAQFGGHLENGDNVFYVVVTSKDATQVNVYTLNVHRSYRVPVKYYNGLELINTVDAYTGYTYTSSYTPNITGYTFNYWKDSNGNRFTSDMIYGPISLYADKTAKTYDVTLDVNGGEELSNNKKTLTYDSNFSLAVPERVGYSFTGWYTSGNDKVTSANGSGVYVWDIASNTTLKAHWDANTYTLTAQSNNTSAGTVTGGGDYKYDSNVTLTASTYSGYTFTGWYKGNEKVSSDLSYTLKMGLDSTYTARWVRVNTQYNSSSGTATQLNGKYKAGESITLTAAPNIGYIFDGWYVDDNKVSDNLTYEIEMPSANTTFIAKWDLDPQLSQFSYTSTATELTIKSVIDKSVTSIVVPDYVTTIQSGAFSGCSQLESITIPFVGGSKKRAIDTYQYPFGYIFGTNSYTDGTATIQHYYGSSTTSTTETIYYIPSSLKRVTVMGGNILRGAFYNCKGLTSITIPDSVTSIGISAFYGCTGLTNITIGNSITSIGDYAFYGSSLMSITIPDSITSIGLDAFHQTAYYNDESNWEDGVLYIDNYLITTKSSIPSEYTIKSGTRRIAIAAFYHCTGPTSITIPDSVTSSWGTR